VLRDRSAADQLLVLLDHVFRRRRRALQQLHDAVAVERADLEAQFICLGDASFEHSRIKDLPSLAT